MSTGQPTPGNWFGSTGDGGRPVPESPQLHVWPKILRKAMVKVGYPPGEALARSLILEGE